MEQTISEVVSEAVVVAEAMMLSEVEQARKDQNALFVKDAGQTGRALIKIQQDIRALKISLNFPKSHPI